MTRFVLVQARAPGEVVAPEEHASFAAFLEVPVHQIDCVSAVTDPLELDRLCDNYDAVLVGGSGKFGVNDDEDWLRPFFDLLGGLAERDFPMFASCFGFQGLCVALGAPVGKDPEAAEVGTYVLRPTPAAAEDPIFSSLPDPFAAQLGHKDCAFELPSAAVWLARSDRCDYQAMRLGQNVYATQFHPELDSPSNRRRFTQYWDEYVEVLGEQEARRILDTFADSREASDLLARFAARLEPSAPG